MIVLESTKWISNQVFLNNLKHEYQTAEQFSQRKTIFEFEVRNKMKYEDKSLKEEVNWVKSTKWLFKN